MNIYFMPATDGRSVVWQSLDRRKPRTRKLSEQGV